MTKINSDITTTVFFVFYITLIVLHSYALSFCTFIINNLRKFLCTEEDLVRRSNIRYNIYFEMV